MKKANHSIKRITAAILSALMLMGTAVSCEKTAPIKPNNVNSEQTSDNTAQGGSAADDDWSDASGEKKPDGSVDSDADEITGIAIKNIGELGKIGKSAKYPLDGDYVLVADLDFAGASFTPIGGSASECGIVSGDNVFSGTFDGRGHTIVGLKMNVSSQDRVHVGLFGSVGSTDENDPAVIKNLVLKDVSIKGQARGSATYAALCGQVSGNVVIDNISIISGSVNVDNDTGDILGIGSLIGQCRTRTETGYSNNTIHVSNIFTNVDVTGSNNGRSMYTSGLIGRIRGSELGTLSNILQIGHVTHEGGLGNAITAGDSGVIEAENVYYLSGCGNSHRDIGQAKSYESLCSGNLPLDDSIWHIEAGLYPLPNDTYESALFSVLDFVTVTLAEGETEDKVESSFTLATEVMGKAIAWKSSSDAIKIDGDRAIVTKPDFGYTDVTLSARADGIIRTYDLRVFSGVTGSIVCEGDTLRAVNYPEGVMYKWVVRNAGNGQTVNTASDKTGEYKLSARDENAVITVEVENCESASYYHSSIPTIYIDSVVDYYSLSKGSYSDATMTISNVSGYPETSYNGDIKIRLRGNSTAYQPKRPFKIKLDEKADLFGMGESKHWALLANYFDRTNLRNKISYDFGIDLGLKGCESMFVNVIYNGTYYGMYELTESIRIAKNRVPIFDWEDEADDIAKAIAKQHDLTKDERKELEDKLVHDLSWVTTGKFEDYTISDYVDTSGYDITGGYLIEDDYYYDETSMFKTTNDMKLMLKNPEYLVSNKEMFNYISGYVQDLEDAIYSPNRLNSDGKHYSEYMDVDSFIDFWMVNTVFKNVELLYKSCYMYKDVGGLLTWGPVWDMDWTSGNHVNLDPTSADYSSWKQGQSQDREYWYKALYNDPWFVLQLYERWHEIDANLERMMEEYDLWADRILGAAKVDNALWQYDWTVESEVSTLREWLANRIMWMDEQMSDPSTLIDSFEYFKASKKIGIKSAKQNGTGCDVTIAVKGEGVKSVELLVNGASLGDFEVTDGCVLTIDKANLREAGLYNAIEVIAKDDAGKYLTVQKRSGQNGSSAMEAGYIYFK